MNYCPKCLKVFNDDDEGQYVFCDTCKLWIHGQCENLNDIKFKVIENQSEYKCSACK